MRIIAGQWRGVPIAAPKGDTTRPTVDRVRESLMSSLNSALCGFEGVVALDAFAGSGACGLELLSRGAESVWFYEMNANAYACIQANIAKLHVDERCYELRKQDVLLHIPAYGHKPFHLVVLDPPYALEAEKVFAFLDSLAATNALAEDAVVIYEHSKDRVIDAYVQQRNWNVLAHKTFGATVIDIFEREQ